MKIRAAYLNSPNTPIEVGDVDLADPRPGEVLVKIGAAGICHSDWHVVTGATKHPLPVVLGHEGAGVIVALGEGVRSLKEGDFVVLNWAPSCGSCFYCEAGQPNLCSTTTGPIWAGTLLDGTTRLSRKANPLYHFSGLSCFAEHAVVPEQSCVPVPKGVPVEIAALIGCAATTGLGAVLHTARVKPGSSVAVFGAGGVGLSIILGAVCAGAKTIAAFDRTEAKRELARKAGATHAWTSGKDDVGVLREVTGGRGADYVFEAIGEPRIQERCLEAVRPGGTLVLAGIAPMGSSTNLPGALVTRQEKTIVGCYYGTGDPRSDFPLYAQMYLERTLPLNTLLSRKYDLERINEAYAEMLDGQIGRNVIVF